MFGNWNHFKNDEKCFLFHLKSSISFSRYLNFCLDFLVMQQNGLIRKTSLVTKFLTSQLGLQTVVMHILPNISRSKGNRTIKFGQLMECDMRNIFLEKLYSKCVGKTSARLFSEKL